MLRALPLIAALSLTIPQAAHAGIGGLLSKLGKVGSKGGKAAKLGVKAGKAGALGKAAVGVTGLVAAERAGLVFAGMGDDAARSAGFLARTTEGELVLVTKAGGQTTHTAESLAVAAGQIAPEGTRASIYLDRSAAAAPEVLARLPSDAELILVDGSRKLPVRRAGSGQSPLDFVVDTADGAVDLGDYLGESEDDGAEDSNNFFIGLVAVVGAIGLYVFWQRRKAQSSAALIGR